MKVSELLDPGLKAAKSPIERHHLFPKGYLEKRGIVERRLTDQIANFAFIEWEENIAVSDNSPKNMPALSSRFDKSDLEKFSYWHALPEGWVDMEYGEFLQARRPLIAKVIKDGFARLATTRDATRGRSV